jgi:hypothetical protein
MSELIFCPPEGGIIHRPSVDLVRQIVLDPDEAYWLRGSADAGLHFKAGEQQSQMILRFRKGLGFCVYFESSPNELPLVLCSKLNDEQIVEVRESGNILKVPKSYFVQPSVAWPAIAAFMESGKAAPDAPWIVFSPQE